MASGLIERIDTWLEKRERQRTLAYLNGITAAVRTEVSHASAYQPGDIIRESARLQRQIATEGTFHAASVARSFALASLAVKRVLGFLPNATQLAAAAVLAEGNIIEMRSGEGKTAVALLAAYLRALNREHVDIATTNDYLAERDYRALGLAYRYLGMEAGIITSRTERKKRKGEYAKHVTYVANQELGFDYLNDHLALDPADQVCAAHDFAVIDEVDSILIDEARTALIVTELNRQALGEARGNIALMRRLLPVVKSLKTNLDYTVDYRRRSVALTDRGLARLAAKLGRDIYGRQELPLIRALWYLLYARVFIHPDEDFIVENGRVILVDEFTGHPLSDRVLFEGLQEAVDVSAGVEPKGEFTIVASITYRNFFKLYRHVAGMTGTAFDAREEFYNLYTLNVVPFRPHQGLLRRDLPTVFFRTAAEKFSAVIREAENARADGAPLLIVGRSIAAAKALSDHLRRQTIPHQLLHAAVSQQETAIIESAGTAGAITVATNMAGRGADIIIDRSIRERSGLRVLGVEHHLSRRVDEQLRGRSGRQGQYGETKMFASLEDELLQVYGDDAFWDYAEAVRWNPEGMSDATLAKGVSRAQEAAQAHDAEMRLSLARFDSVVDRHRSAVYTLRSRILNTARYELVLLPEIHHMLIYEADPPLGRDELEGLIQPERVPHDSRKELRRFLHSGDGMPSPVDDAPRGEYASKRSAILRALDAAWQRYLESIQWLENWISLTGIAGDPYRAFVETADRMFRDMRREFAVAAARLLFSHTP